MAAKAQGKNSEDVKRASYVRQACLQWMTLNKPEVLAKIRELAEKAHPKTSKSRSTFVLPKELASLK
jgi:hypothetical protein